MAEEAVAQQPEPESEGITVEVQGYGSKPPKPSLTDEEVEKMDQLPPEDEIGNYAKDAQKRIRAQHIANQEWRRRVAQANRDVAAATSLATQLYNENQQLKADDKRKDNALIEQALQRSEAQLVQAKQRFVVARQNNDIAQEVAAQEEIARATAEAHNLRLLRPAAPPSQTQTAPQPQQPQAQQQPLPPPLQQPQQEEEGTRQWKARNTWWDQPGEEVMTNFAVGVAQSLERQGIGPLNKPKEYWSKIDEQLRVKFPEKFGMEPSEKPTTNGSRPVAVAGATRTNGAAPGSQPRAGRHVTLTESQVKLARSLGLTNEQYAVQLVRDEQLPEGSYHDVATK